MMWQSIKDLPRYFWRDLSFKRGITLGLWAWAVVALFGYQAIVIVVGLLTRNSS